MKPIVLIAANFVREQRWPLILLLVWVVGTGGVAGFAGTRVALDDVLFFLKQQAVYGVAFSAFLAASAIHNERKSRRILAVMSKGIHRGQYIAGLLGGAWFGALLYCAAMAATGAWIFANSGLPQEPLWWLMLVLAAACLLTSTVSMFFSTFLSPLFSTAATALAIGVSAALGQFLDPHWLNVLPVYHLMADIMRFAPRQNWAPAWIPLYWALLQSAALWVLATLVFNRRDIAVPVE